MAGSALGLAVMVALASGQTDTFHIVAKQEHQCIKDRFPLSIHRCYTAIYSSNYPELSFDQRPPLEKKPFNHTESYATTFFLWWLRVKLDPF